MPILNQLKLVLTELTAPIDQTAHTPKKGVKKGRFAHIFNLGESDKIDSKKTRSNPAIAIAQQEKNSKKRRSSPSFKISRQVPSNENKNTSNSVRITKNDLDSKDFISVDSKNSPSDFSKIADYTKKAINSIKHAFPQKIAIASPAPAPRPTVFTSETQQLIFSLPLEENLLFPYQNEIAAFSKAEEELKAKMLGELNLNSLKEAEEESLIKEKCKDKINFLKNKWGYLANELKDKNGKLNVFSDATKTIQNQIAQKIQQINALKLEAKEKLDVLNTAWDRYLAEHFIDVPDDYSKERTKVYNKSEENYHDFLKDAEQHELLLRIQFNEVETYLQSFSQQEYLAHSAYRKLKLIYQQKSDSFEPAITFIEKVKSELNTIHQTTTQLPLAPTEQLETQRKNTKDTLAIALAAISAAEYLFDTLKGDLTQNEQQNYEIDFKKLQAITVILKENGSILLNQIESLQTDALQYNKGREDALNPDNDASMPYSIQLLTTAIQKASLRNDNSEERTLQNATSGGLENLKRHAEHILYNAQTYLSSLQRLCASLSEESNPALKKALTEYNELLNDFNNQNSIMESYLERVTERELVKRDRIANENQTKEAMAREKQQLEIERQKREARQNTLGKIAALQLTLLAKSDPARNPETAEDEQLLKTLPALSENLTENIVNLKKTLENGKHEQNRSTDEFGNITKYAPKAKYENLRLTSVITAIENETTQLNAIKDIVTGHCATIEVAFNAKSLLLQQRHIIYKEINKLAPLNVDADENTLEQRLNLLSEKNQELEELLEQNKRQLKIVKDDIDTFLTNGHIEAYVNSANNIEENDPVQTINDVCDNLNKKVKKLQKNAAKEIAGNQEIIVRLKTRNLPAQITYLSDKITDIQIQRMEAPAEIDKTHHLEQSKRNKITNSTKKFKKHLLSLLEKVRTSDYLSDDEKKEFFKNLKKSKTNLTSYAVKNQPHTQLLRNEHDAQSFCATSDAELTDLLIELKTKITLERADLIASEIHKNRIAYENTLFKKVNKDILEKTTSKLKNELRGLENIERNINDTITKNRSFIARASNVIQKSFWGLFRLSPIAAAAITGAIIGFHFGLIPGAILGGIVGAGVTAISEEVCGVAARKLTNTKAKQEEKAKYEKALKELDTNLSELMLVDNSAQPGNKISTIKTAPQAVHKTQPKQSIDSSSSFFQSSAGQPSVISMTTPQPLVSKQNYSFISSWSSYLSPQEKAGLRQMHEFEPGFELGDELEVKKKAECNM